MRWDEMGDDVRGRLLSITEGSVEWINLIGSSQISHIHPPHEDFHPTHTSRGQS